MLTITEISDADVDAVIALWQRCGLTRPWNEPGRDIAFARQSPNATILVGRDGGAVAASVMTGHDGHRGAVYYVGVDPAHRGRGHGRAIMRAAEDWLRGRGMWKMNLLIRGENEAARSFYKAIGYTLEPNVQMGRWFDGKPA